MRLRRFLLVIVALGSVAARPKADAAPATAVPSPTEAAAAVAQPAAPVAFLAPGVLPIGARAPGDAAIGATKVAVCAGCHGADGNSINKLWPKLAEQNEVYLVKQLEDFRSGARKDPLMTPMAAALAEEDIGHVSAFFASQGRRHDQVKIVGLVSTGQELYQWGRPADGIVPCAGCHGSKGHGYVGMRPGGFPAIGGQHAEYLEKQLMAFRDGSRANDPNGVMRSVAARLSDRDIWALAEYTSGLQY